MAMRTVFFSVLAATLFLFGGCGDDAQVSGVGQSDAPSDLAIATDAGTDAVSPLDVTADLATEVTAMTLSGPCESCETKADCGDSLDCLALLNGSYCSRTCTGAADCSDGFLCDFASTTDTAKHCLPPKYACEGCVATGCASDQVCDPLSGQCINGKTPCTPCEKVSDCGPGLKCATLASPDFSTQKICMPNCGENGACQPGSLCEKTDAGNICGFMGLACCYGAKCQADAGCAKCPNKCILGSCVDCLLDKECPGGHCDTTSHVCVNTVGCPDAKPAKLPDGTCVQCAQDGDCKPGLKCDMAVHACIATPLTCKACNKPYPDCAKFDGIWTCVECTSDATCAAQKLGTCSPKAYACSGDSTPATGGPVVTCKLDSDCKNVGGSAFDLACDATKTGLCYDKGLKCDNVVAFCNSKKGCTCQPLGADTPVGTCSCGF